MREIWGEDGVGSKGRTMRWDWVMGEVKRDWWEVVVG